MIEFDPTLHGVSPEELLEYRTTNARLVRIEREAAYEASLPKLPMTINFACPEDIPDVIRAVAKVSTAPLGYADILTIIGMVLEAVGNEEFKGFAAEYSHHLPPLKPPGFPSL